MRVPSVALGLVFAAVFIQTVAGKLCNCAACWENGSPGIDALRRSEALLVSGSFNDNFFSQVHVLWTNKHSQMYDK